MSKKEYLSLLFVYGFFCQGIVTTLSTNNIISGKSTNFLVRNKRVINHEPGGHILARMEDINYMVCIRENHRLRCAGAILSRFNVITAAPCVASDELWHYQVQSASPYQHRSMNHSVITKLVYNGNPPYGHHDSIALLRVEPVFTFGSNVGPIHLHVEPVLTGTMALISGWGRVHSTSPPMEGKPRLRCITLPIMNHRECIASYAGHFEITHKHICTYDDRKLCALNDIGAPLVIDNCLVGIHIYKGESKLRINPDVFLDVQIPEYSSWIRENTRFR